MKYSGCRVRDWVDGMRIMQLAWPDMDWQVSAGGSLGLDW